MHKPAPNDPALYGVPENAGFMTPDQGKMAKNIRYFHKNLVPILKIMGFSVILKGIILLSCGFVKRGEGKEENVGNYLFS